MGVAFPPMSVPSASVHARMFTSIPSIDDMDFITGIIVAASGILSTNALAIAATQRMIAIISVRFPPLTRAIKSAITESTPVCSSPPTDINKPMKNKSVL